MTSAPRALHAMALAGSLVTCAAAPPCTPLRTAPRLAPLDFKSCGPVTDFINGVPSVVRYAAWTTDSVRRPDLTIAGPHTSLCDPVAVARGPRGEVYVLNHAPRPWYVIGRVAPKPGTYWVNWVTVYDPAARGDAAPIRTLHIPTDGFSDPTSLAVDRDGYLYIGSGMSHPFDAGSVTVFAANAEGNVAPVRVLSGPTSGVREPTALAVDRRGQVYVLNADGVEYVTPVKGELPEVFFNDLGANGKWPRPASDDTVRIFGPDAAGDTGPCRMLTTAAGPVALAVDGEGRLYLASERSESRTIRVYDAEATGQIAPLHLITLAPRQIWDDMQRPKRLVLGRGDSLYVRSRHNLSVFAPGDTHTLSRTFFKDAPELFALDRHDTLYSVSKNEVAVYPPGYSGGFPPVRTLGGPSTGIRNVSAVAVDRRGHLYVAIQDSSLIRVFAPGAIGDQAPIRTIAGRRTRLAKPTSIALDEDDRLYVANGPLPGDGGAVRVYAPGASGDDRPLRVLMGWQGKRMAPGAIAFDSGREMYLSHPGADGGGQVTVFRREASEDEAPLRSLRGPQTGLRGPTSLAFDTAGSLYVLNPVATANPCQFSIRWPSGGGGTPVSPTVTVYSPGARGDVAPARTIVLGPPEKPVGATGHRGLAVGATGAVQVWSSGGAAVYPAGVEGSVEPSRTIVEPPAGRTEATGVWAGKDGWLYETYKPTRLSPVC